MDKELQRVKDELLNLRMYCNLTFGESHPEIKKCVHEVRVEELENEIVELKYTIELMI